MKLISPFTYTLLCSLKKNILAMCSSIEIVFFFLMSVPLIFFSLSPKLEPYVPRSYFLFVCFSEDDTVLTKCGHGFA